MPQNEIWKTLDSYPGYAVSSAGRVKSLGRHVACGPGGRGRRYVAERILKPGRMARGHLMVVVGKGGSRTVHSLVACAFLGPPPEGTEIRHRNGDPADNRLENLAYGTRAENVADMQRHGTGPGLLSDDQVRYVKQSEKSIAELARELKVDYQVTYGIKRRGKYAWVTPQGDTQ